MSAALAPEWDEQGKQWIRGFRQILDTCSVCGEISWRWHHDNWCMECEKERDRERNSARNSVRRAVQRGELQRLPDGITVCIDCGNSATCWDHRDYREPLRVAPVCNSCNNKRGSGFTTIESRSISRGAA